MRLQSHTWQPLSVLVLSHTLSSRFELTARIFISHKFLDERFAVQLPLDHVFALLKWDTCLTVKDHLLPLEHGH